MDDRSLSPQEAAARLGVHVGTLRRWEREGKLIAIRTAGGQRRYREEDIRALGQQGSTRRGNAASSPARTKVRRPPADHQLELPPELADSEWPAFPDVETDAARDGEPRDPAGREAQEREARVRETAARLAKERHEEAARQAERDRLEELKAHGRAQAAAAPVSWQAKVTRDLERYVTAEQFPASLSPWTAREYVRARVEAVLEPWRRSEEDRRRRERLISYGKLHAFSETMRWGREEREGACEEVEGALEEEVEADWDESDVAELVEEVLADWADGDEDFGFS